jgi:hypothetical protein
VEAPLLATPKTFWNLRDKLAVQFYGGFEVYKMDAALVDANSHCPHDPLSTLCHLYEFVTLVTSNSNGRLVLNQKDVERFFAKHGQSSSFFKLSSVQVFHLASAMCHQAGITRFSQPG